MPVLIHSVILFVLVDFKNVCPVPVKATFPDYDLCNLSS